MLASKQSTVPDMDSAKESGKARHSYLLIHAKING